MPKLLSILMITGVFVFLLTACQPIMHDRYDAPAAVTETTVAINSEGQTVVGTLALPTHGAPPFPVVLLLHGFTNVRDELPVAGTDEAMYQ